MVPRSNVGERIDHNSHVRDLDEKDVENVNK
jgi:hypothetical protein